MTCTWDWNISGIPDNNYWITTEIRGGTDTNTTSMERSFRVNPVADTTLWQVEGNDFNAGLPNFTYSSDGNLKPINRHKPRKLRHKQQNNRNDLHLGLEHLRNNRQQLLDSN
jgi:hypothetical protein